MQPHELAVERNRRAAGRQSQHERWPLPKRTREDARQPERRGLGRGVNDHAQHLLAIHVRRHHCLTRGNREREIHCAARRLDGQRSRGGLGQRRLQPRDEA